MRINREIIGIGVLLLLFVLAAVIMSGRDDSKSRVVGKESSPDPSIYNDRASGSKAFYDYVQELGYQTGVWRRRWSKLGESKANVLIAVEPESSAAALLTGGSPLGNGGDDDDSQESTLLQASDADALKTWLRPGRTAVILTSNLQNGQNGTSTFANAVHVSVVATGETAVREFGPVQPTPLGNGVISIRMDAGSRIQSSEPDLVPLFGNPAEVVVAALPVGRGRLIIISDGQFASNGNLGFSDNAVFLANMLARYSPPGSRVLFDEYHHGEADLPGSVTVWSALGRPLQLAIVQALIAMLLAFAVAAARFGTAVPLVRAGERTSAEYVASLSSLYRKAGASTTALEMIYRQFLRETTSRLGLSADVSLEQLADAAGRRGGVSVMDMRRLLALCEQHIDTGKVSEAELLDLVRRMDRIRKDIGIA